MSKIFIRMLIAFFTMTAATTFAEETSDTTETGWQESLILNFTTTQSGYSDSWTGGEAGSVNWVSNLKSSAEKQFSKIFNFKSTIKLSFGQTLTQDAETKDWSKPKKSTDLIDFENVGRFTLGGFVDPYVAFRLESQFFDARKADQKLFFSPLKFTESAGIVRMFYKRKNDQLSSRLGLGIRQIIKSDIDSLTNIMVDEVVDSTFTDGGFELVTDATFSLNKSLRFIGKLTLFKALFFSKSDVVKGTESEDYWKTVDVNWEIIVSAQVSKIITVNLYTQFLYDKETSKKGRFKETVAIGFVFKML